MIISWLKRLINKIRRNDTTPRESISSIRDRAIDTDQKVIFLDNRELTLDFNDYGDGSSSPPSKSPEEVIRLMAELSEEGIDFNKINEEIHSKMDEDGDIIS